MIMAIRYVPSFPGIGEASAIAAAADDAIAHVAEQVLATAQSLAAADDELTQFGAALHIDTGTRPKGRGYRRVIADTSEGDALEWGDNATVRRRILGQAAGIQL